MTSLGHTLTSGQIPALGSSLLSSLRPPHPSSGLLQRTHRLHPATQPGPRSGKRACWSASGPGARAPSAPPGEEKGQLIGEGSLELSPQGTRPGRNLRAPTEKAGLGGAGDAGGRALGEASSSGHGVYTSHSKDPKGETWWGRHHPAQKEVEKQAHFCPEEEDTRGPQTRGPRHPSLCSLPTSPRTLTPRLKGPVVSEGEAAWSTGT